jgi:glycerol-3-phosphate acyltransferase PlsY
MSLLLVWRHSANIGKLLAGTESKLGHKAALAVAPAAEHHEPAHPPRRGHKHSHDAAHAQRKRAKAQLGEKR